MFCASLKKRPGKNFVVMACWFKGEIVRTISYCVFLNDSRALKNFNLLFVS